MKPMIYIKNHATGEEITREMTDDEIASIILDQTPELEPEKETPTE